MRQSLFFIPYVALGIDVSVTRNVFPVFDVCGMPVQIRVTEDMSDAMDKVLVKLTGTSVPFAWLD